MPSEYEVLLVNMYDFVGLDDLWSITFGNWNEFQNSFVIMLITMVGIGIFGYSTAAKWIHWKIRNMKIVDEAGKTHSSNELYLLSYYLIFGILLLLELVPHTVTTVLFLFSSRFDIIAVKYWNWNTIVPSLHGAFYLIELEIRSNQSFSKMLILHHSIWFTIISLGMASTNIFVLKLALLLNYFVVWEFGLFLLMFYSKLVFRKMSAIGILFGRAAVIIYGVSRIPQLLFLVAFFAGAYSRMKQSNALGEYWSCVLLSVVLFLCQWYTLDLYLKWKTLWNGSTYDLSSLLKRRRGQVKSNVNAVETTTVEAKAVDLEPLGRTTGV
eukprot:TRINITY_DN18344_c0_g2_i1.p1 TRINITY_DN18344_c0_g2~~TRINITY_DN18344_c0_g2_i1.p1  ORF type:complete len:325 (+),score=71.72 TRINITY_DN18344_c0_g2_i1:328-1302(+)